MKICVYDKEAIRKSEVDGGGGRDLVMLDDVLLPGVLGHRF